MHRVIIVIGLLSGLAACDAGPSAVMHDGDGKSPTSAAPDKAAAVAPAQDNVEEASMPVPGAASAVTREATEAGPPLPKGARAAVTTTQYGDWPLWSSNSKYSADDNAHYQYGKHGDEVGARTYEDFVSIVHGFVHNPPPGTEKVVRKNGDTLFYNARENVFAVVTKDGAPRTLFRPDDGAGYWQKQKEIEANRGAGDSR